MSGSDWPRAIQKGVALALRCVKHKGFTCEPGGRAAIDGHTLAGHVPADDIAVLGESRAR